MQVTINEAAVERFMTYVEKLNRRAVKIDVSALMVGEIGREIVKIDGKSDQEDIFEVMVTYEITGDTPVINGWEFVARIEHDEVLGNILKTAPGKELPLEFWESAGSCGHCNTKRFRKDTFVLRNIETGEHKQIGRQCVRDFIGYDNPADMVWWCGIESEIRNECDSYCGIRGEDYFSVEEVIARACAVNSMYGFVSRAMADEQNKTSTSSHVATTFQRQMHPEMQEYVRAICIESVKHVDQVELIVGWINSWDAETIQKSEFNFNVHKLVTRGICRFRDFGLVSCLPTMFLKHMDMIAGKTVRSNEFLGIVGEKLTVDVEVKKIYSFSGFYGVSYLILMEDEDGNSVTWNASNLNNLNSGDKIQICGRVKDHSVYKERNQTVLTRCKIVMKG